MGNPQGWVNHEPHTWSDGTGSTHYPSRAVTRSRREDGVPNCTSVSAGQPRQRMYCAGKIGGLCGMPCDVPSAALLAREPAMQYV
jgi:hypothetical protein